MSPKEINYLLRYYAMKEGLEQINYTNFADDLYTARFMLANSRTMDTNLEIIESVLLEACQKISQDGETVTLTELTNIMRDSKQLILTPFQIAMLLGFSKPNRDAQVKFKPFAKVCQEKIEA